MKTVGALQLLTYAGMFFRKMKERLLDKQRQGWHGWGQISPGSIRKRLLKNVEHGDWVDVANLALILWAQEKKGDHEPKKDRGDRASLPHQPRLFGE